MHVCTLQKIYPLKHHKTLQLGHQRAEIKYAAGQVDRGSGLGARPLWLHD